MMPVDSEDSEAAHDWHGALQEPNTWHLQYISQNHWHLESGILSKYHILPTKTLKWTDL